MEELVSIIMPTYNRGYIIQRAIDSVLAQTYENWELIIVDDGSVDDTEEVVNRNADKRIKYLKYTPNKGANHARNMGLDNARGKWITLLDSDAVYEVDSLKYRMGCLQGSKADIVWTRAKFFDFEENVILFPDEETDFLNNREAMVPLSLKKGLINTSTLLISRKCYEDGYRFDESLSRFQDWDFFWGIILDERYKYLFCDKVTANNFLQENSISVNVPICENYVKLIEKHIDNFRKHDVVEYVMDRLYSFTLESQVCAPVIGLLEYLNGEELRHMMDKSLEMNINQTKALKQMHMASRKMDWRLPLEKIPDAARLVIYGAGEMGTSFVRQIADNHYCNVVLWVDRDHEKMGKAVHAPEEIMGCNYDYVLVSILKEEIAKEAVDFLVRLGVDRTKILTP